MKQTWMRRSALLALAAALLTGSASALFGGKEETAQAEEGAPAVLDVEITT